MDNKSQVFFGEYEESFYPRNSRIEQEGGLNHPCLKHAGAGYEHETHEEQIKINHGFYFYHEGREENEDEKI